MMEQFGDLMKQAQEMQERMKKMKIKQNEPKRVGEESDVIKNEEREDPFKDYSNPPKKEETKKKTTEKKEK